MAKRITKEEYEDHKKRRHWKHRKHKKWKVWRMIPAPVVFYLAAIPSLAAAGYVYLKGVDSIAYAVGACILIIWVLIINDRGGFRRSRHMPRAGEPRRKFNELEIVGLGILLMINLIVIALKVMDLRS